MFNKALITIQELPKIQLDLNDPAGEIIILVIFLILTFPIVKYLIQNPNKSIELSLFKINKLKKLEKLTENVHIRKLIQEKIDDEIFYKLTGKKIIQIKRDFILQYIKPKYNHYSIEYLLSISPYIKVNYLLKNYEIQIKPTEKILYRVVKFIIWLLILMSTVLFIIFFFISNPIKNIRILLLAIFLLLLAFMYSKMIETLEKAIKFKKYTEEERRNK